MTPETQWLGTTKLGFTNRSHGYVLLVRRGSGCQRAE